MARHPVFHADFQAMPYWWEAYRPTAQDPLDLPAKARVAIVGGGYAGLSTALELARHGIDCVVLEAAELGFGASTRNGGAVSGGVNIGKGFGGRSKAVSPERTDALLADAADAFGLIERLIAEEGIDCFWQKKGRFVGAWTPKHYAAQAARVEKLNAAWAA
jgi:glycine/D-amino acid oxidase-like deaminating enzyme